MFSLFGYPTDPYRLLAEFDRAFDTRAGQARRATREDEISETEAAYKLTFVVPGLREEDVDIQLEERELVITAREGTPREGKALVRERRPRDFSRSYQLPETVDTAAIGASLEAGILTITLPKTQPMPKKRIAVRQGVSPLAS